jgi:hypothetical protein
MKPSELQKLIKQAVKEAIAEEMKDILLEAIRAPKQQIVETREIETNGDDRVKLRENMMNILGDMGGISMNSSHAQNFTGTPGYTPPPSANTAAQGSALPPGEVNMDQIMGFIKKG